MLESAIRACSGRFLVMFGVLQTARLCRENFFVSKSWEGSSRHLKPFWARLSVCHAERANRRLSVSAGEGPPSVNKVLSGTPLPDC